MTTDDFAPVIAAQGAFREAVIARVAAQVDLDKAEKELPPTSTPITHWRKVWQCADKEGETGVALLEAFRVYYEARGRERVGM